MSEPVIFDDGGSTRIKRADPSIIGEMDSLLTVTDPLPAPVPPLPPLPPNSKGSTHTIDVAYTKVLIVCQDKSGAPFSMGPTPFNRVLVASGHNQNVLSERVNAGNKLKITVFSTGADPIVEAKQHKKKRRYVVSNSGPIETVAIDGVVVYDTGPGAVLPVGAQRPILYTSVVLT